MKSSVKARSVSVELHNELQAQVPAGNVGFQLIGLYDIYVRYLSSRTRSRLMNLNITQWRTLTLVRWNPGCTQRSLAQAVGIDPSSMTPIIDFFETKRWLRRHNTPSNRSAYAVRLTPAGLRAYKVIEREMGEMEQRFARLLGKKNSLQLVDLLQKLRRGLLQEVSSSKRLPARSTK